MELTLAELLPLRVSLSKLIQERLRERDDVSFVEFAKGDEEIVSDRTFSELSEEIQEIRKDYRELEFLLAKANVENTINWDNEKLSIVEAIELAKQLQGEVIKLKMFATKKPIERVRGYGVDEVIYTKTLYDPSKVKGKAERLEKLVNRLSMAIEKKNHLAKVEFPEAKKYL